MKKLYEKYLDEAPDKLVLWTVEKTWTNVKARTAADAVLATKKLKHDRVRAQKAPKGKIVEL